MLILHLSEQHHSHIIFSDLSTALNDIANIPDAFIITEEKILNLYPSISQLSIPFLVLNISEHQKNFTTLHTILDFFVQHSITKHHTAVVIGGGVLHDIGLFACSVFKRGIPVISVPTTLLSMVDASIGGKNAINFQHYKNIIGSIYLPQKNFIVPDFLHTLPKEQLLSGWAEIIKIALVYDENFYHTCITHIHKDILPSTQIIQHAIKTKIQIIETDLRDNHQRQLLNFGHTIAHAIEGVWEEQQQYIPHGIAVATGMLIESAISTHLQILPHEKFETISNHLQNIFPIVKVPSEHIDSLLSKIQQDKKNTAQQIQMTLLSNIGKGKIKVPVNISLIQNVLQQFI